MNHASFSSPQVRGAIMVAISGMCFGLMGFFGSKLFSLQLSVTNMLFWRFLIATTWISLAMCYSKKNIFSAIHRPRSLLPVFTLGAVSYSCASAFFFLACKHIGTGIAMVIFFSFPVFVTLFSWLFDHWRMNKIAFISLLAVICGIFLLRGQGAITLNVAGITLALIAAFSFATYVYGSKHTTKNIDADLLTLLVCIGNTLIFFVMSIYTRTFSFPVSLHAIGYIIAIGIIATALPIQLLLNGLKYISPVKASILSVLEPVVTVLVGYTFLNESMSYLQLLGMLIVIFGAILIQFDTAEESNNKLRQQVVMSKSLDSI